MFCTISLVFPFEPQNDHQHFTAIQSKNVDDGHFCCSTNTLMFRRTHSNLIGTHYYSTTTNWTCLLSSGICCL
jgi:hypothetical protein